MIEHHGTLNTCKTFQSIHLRICDQDISLKNLHLLVLCDRKEEDYQSQWGSSSLTEMTPHFIYRISDSIRLVSTYLSSLIEFSNGCVLTLAKPLLLTHCFLLLQALHQADTYINIHANKLSYLIINIDICLTQSRAEASMIFCFIAPSGCRASLQVEGRCFTKQDLQSLGKPTFPMRVHALILSKG